MFQTSVIELSRSALQANLKFLTRRIGPRARFSSVIKGNAYGHGVEYFVPIAEECGVRHFSVFGADEALAAHHASTVGSHIMIMGWMDEPETEWAIRNEVSFWVFDLERLYSALNYARGMKQRARIHLELETGLNRTGLQEDQLHRAVETIRGNPEHFQVDGVCTHFAGAESVANYLRIQRQIERFHSLIAYLRSEGIEPGLRHAACSAAIFFYPETVLDMVRCGIAQYGYWPSRETKMRHVLERAPNQRSRVRDPLRRVIKWKSKVMSVKDVGPGEFVGYGNAYLTTRQMRIASVPVGYFHGFSRNLSNLGHVLIHGRQSQVVGVVNMNMMLVDVTDMPGVSRGDEVVIIGRQRRIDITVASFGDLTRYLNYEVLVRLPSEIPRVIVE
jgi:alanine racemase